MATNVFGLGKVGFQTHKALKKPTSLSSCAVAQLYKSNEIINAGY
jgi:hypothetical protein